MNDVTYLSVKNWGRYQHYKDREPIWIKLYSCVLDDKKVNALPISTQLLWYKMLSLAARYENAVAYRPELLARETGMPLRFVRDGLENLLVAGLLRETKTPRRVSPRKRERKPTGLRLVRGSHGQSYVPDPEGTDRPPAWYGGALPRAS